MPGRRGADDAAVGEEPGAEREVEIEGVDRSGVGQARPVRVVCAGVPSIATSGYSTDEYQLEAAVETLTILATVWEGDNTAFQGIGDVKVGLDLTVDGRRFVIPNENMVAVAARRMTPQAALGI